MTAIIIAAIGRRGMADIIINAIGINAIIIKADPKNGLPGQKLIENYPLNFFLGPI